jgi:curved DNA-binding protein CbpA
MVGDPGAEARAGHYYQRLEVGPSASREDIVRAYRRLALAAHPDAHPEDPEAPRRFRELTEAYEVLADDARRHAYDQRRGRGGIPVRVIPSPAGAAPVAQPGPPGRLLRGVGPVFIDGVAQEFPPPHPGGPLAGRPALTELLELLGWWPR